MEDTQKNAPARIPDAPAMQTFSNPLFGELRGMLFDGRAWFVGTDVAAMLGFDHAPHMFRMLDEDERDTITLRNGERKTSFVAISEGGFYHCIFASKKDGAKAVRRWVTDEVLPALMRNGSYTMQSTRQALPPPDATGANANDVRLALIAEMKAAFMRGDISRKAYTEWLVDNTDRLLATGTKPRGKKHIPGEKQVLETLREFAAGAITVTGDKKDYVPLKELYAQYSAYSDICGMEPCAQSAFTHVLKIAFERITVKQKKIKGYPVQIAAGCTLNDTTAVSSPENTKS